MENKCIYTLEEFAGGVVTKYHKNIAPEQVQFALNFIGSKLLEYVKKNLECIIHDPDEGLISIKSGSGEYKFLATYDVSGKHKMRRFIGQSFLGANSSGLHEEAHKNVHDDTMLAVLNKIWSQHRPGKKPKTPTDERRENYSKGLLCMKAGLFLNAHDLNNDVEIALFDENDDLYRVKFGHGTNKVLATFNKTGNAEVLHFVGQEYSLASEVNTYLFKTEVIDKRSIGKLMVKICGNEGADDDKNSAFIRKLLQSLITYFEKGKDKAWTDNEVTIYDKKLNAFIMKVGKGRKEIVVSLDEKGEVFVQ